MFRLKIIKSDSANKNILAEDINNFSLPVKNNPVEKFLDELTESGNDLQTFSSNLLIKIAREKEIIQGLFLIYDEVSGLRYLAGYACNKENKDNLNFRIGEGLPGQVARDRKPVNLKNIPGGYIIVRTGLGQASPNSLFIFPVIYNEKLLGVIELASFHEFTKDDESFFLELSGRIGEHILKISKSTEEK